MARSAGVASRSSTMRRNVAVAVPDDPPVPGRVAPRGEHGDRVARPVMPVDELPQRLAAQQRHVAVAHHDGAGDGPDRLGDHADRVPGAELLVLAHDPRLRRDRGHLRADQFPAMPDDDHQPGRVKLVGRRERVPEQGAAAQRVQHLGGAGLHALALARGEDDDCGRGSFAHEKSISSDIAPNICQGHHPREPHCAERRRFCLLAPHRQDTCPSPAGNDRRAPPTWNCPVPTVPARGVSQRAGRRLQDPHPAPRSRRTGRASGAGCRPPSLLKF